MHVSSYIIIGYSGHGLVVAEAALLLKWHILGYYDFVKSEKDPFGLAYLGYEEKDRLPSPFDVSVLIGLGDNAQRSKKTSMLRQLGYALPALIHPFSNISATASLGSGVFINRGVCVNTAARIGDDVILNTGCIVEHECLIGNGAHIAPGAVLAGNVRIGPGSFIGANSVIRQGINIGAGVVIGAGSVVVKDVPDHSTVYGNPARIR